MATRKIIHIDEDKCIGCGQCVNACPNSALKMVDGKAKLTGEVLCDGIGACIGHCPVGALTIEERVAPACAKSSVHTSAPGNGGGCPGVRHWQREDAFAAKTSVTDGVSALAAWPIQLHLVQPSAPQFQDADVLIAASCTAFACGGFHATLLHGRGLMIACPKLDRQEGYHEKLVAFFREAQPASVTVARMEVPCCTGLLWLVQSARDEAGSLIPIREVVLSLSGDVQDDRMIPAEKDRV